MEELDTVIDDDVDDVDVDELQEANVFIPEIYENEVEEDDAGVEPHRHHHQGSELEGPNGEVKKKNRRVLVSL